jgi:hypothetical protein
MTSVPPGTVYVSVLWNATGRQLVREEEGISRGGVVVRCAFTIRDWRSGKKSSRESRSRTDRGSQGDPKEHASDVFGCRDRDELVE